MSELIAVTDLLIPDILKKHALLFNKFAHPLPRSILTRPRASQHMETEQYRAELDWLFENGICVDFPREADVDIQLRETLLPFFETINKEDFVEELTLLGKKLKGASQNEILELLRFPDPNTLEPTNDAFASHSDFVNYITQLTGFKSVGLLFNLLLKMMGQYLPNEARLMAATLRTRNGMDAYPLFIDNDFFDFARQTSIKTEQKIDHKENIIRIVLNRLPKPDESVSWEQILDYRNDPDSKGKLLALRNWMHDVARAKLTPHEIEDKLDWLLYEYCRHLDLHKMKYKMGIIETILTVGAEFLENIVKVKWSEAAKTLFRFKHQRIALLEAEMRAPGSEIAYLADAKDKFQSC